MLKIGVLGVGHLGKIHLNCIKQIEDYHLVGFYDVDRDLAQSLSLETKIRCFDSVDELIRESMSCIISGGSRTAQICGCQGGGYGMQFDNQ